MRRPRREIPDARRPASHAVAFNQPPELVAVALRLIFRAVAHQRHAAAAREPLDEAQRELLSVVLDRAAPRVHRAVHEQLATILAEELRPRDAARLTVPKETLARTERRHPHVVPVR